MTPELFLLCLLAVTLIALTAAHQARRRARERCDALEARLTNVRHLHHNGGTRFHFGDCPACGEPWPCRTYAATGYVPAPTKEPLP